MAVNVKGVDYEQISANIDYSGLEDYRVTSPQKQTLSLVIYGEIVTQLAILFGFIQERSTRPRA